VGTKQIIEKLSGNKKFEVEEKLGIVDLTRLVEKASDENREIESQLLEKMEKSVQGIPVFKDDMENPMYKKLIQTIKELKKPPSKK
jgi:hypothetical protein